jgi:hypothetical protein
MRGTAMEEERRDASVRRAAEVFIVFLVLRMRE